MVGGDSLRAVNSGHGLRESDEGFELPDGDPVSGLGIGGVVHTEGSVGITEGLGSSGIEDGLDGSCESDVSLESVNIIIRCDGLLPLDMKVNNMLGDSEVNELILLIENDEEEIEPRHDRGRHVNVELQGAGLIVAAKEGVSSGED